MKLNYLVFPIMFRYSGGDGNPKFYATLGWQYGLLTKARLMGNYAGSADTSFIATNRFTKNDPGINFGLGADITLTDFLYLSAGIEFTYGYADLNDNTDLKGPMNPGWRVPHHGIYKQSNNATGGLKLGIHYLLQR